MRAVENLKQHLESGEDEEMLSVSDACTVASLLKQYLRDLPEGLIDPKVQHALVQYYQGKKNMIFFFFAINHVCLFSEEICCVFLFVPGYLTEMFVQFSDTRMF